MYSASLLVNSHRAEGRKPGESRDGRKREGIGGSQENGFPDVSLLCSPRWGKTEMSGPKERAKVVEACQDPLQLPGTE